MSKTIRSTATDKNEPIEPILDPIKGIKEPDTPDFTAKPITLPPGGINGGSQQSTRSAGFDPEYNATFRPDDPSMNAVNANKGQSGWTRGTRAVGGGLLEGLSGAAGVASPLVNVIGDLVGAIDAQAGLAMQDFDDKLKEQVAEGMPIHEKNLSEDAGFWEEFGRASTAKSIVSSAAEFGTIGLASGFAVARLGALVARGGTSLASVVKSRSVADKIINSSKSFKAFMDSPLTPIGNNPVSKFLHGKLTSTTVARAAITNSIEGRTMGRELEKNMYNFYKEQIEDPNVSPELKADMLNDINNAGTAMQVRNIAMMVTDIIGLHAIDNVVGRSAQRGVSKSLWQEVRRNLKLVAPSEGIEEVIQNIFQAKSQQEGIQNIEENYSQSTFGADLPQLYKAEETLLYTLNPEEAKKTARQNAMGYAELIYELGTSRQAGIEGLSGILGAGPQYVVTGLVPTMANNASRKARLKVEESFKKDQLAAIFTSLATTDIMTEATINQLVADLQGSATNGDGARKIVEDFAIARAAYVALSKGAEGTFRDYLEESKEAIKAGVADGTITEDEADAYLARIEGAEDILRENHNLQFKPNASQLMNAKLNAISLQAAIDIYDAQMGNLNNITSSPQVEPEGINTTPVSSDDNNDANDTTTDEGDTTPPVAETEEEAVPVLPPVKPKTEDEEEIEEEPDTNEVLDTEDEADTSEPTVVLNDEEEDAAPEAQKKAKPVLTREQLVKALEDANLNLKALQTSSSIAEAHRNADIHTKYVLIHDRATKMKSEAKLTGLLNSLIAKQIGIVRDVTPAQEYVDGVLQDRVDDNEKVVYRNLAERKGIQSTIDSIRALILNRRISLIVSAERKAAKKEDDQAPTQVQEKRKRKSAVNNKEVAEADYQGDSTTTETKDDPTETPPPNTQFAPDADQSTNPFFANASPEQIAEFQRHMAALDPTNNPEGISEGEQTNDITRVKERIEAINYLTGMVERHVDLSTVRLSLEDLTAMLGMSKYTGDVASIAAKIYAAIYNVEEGEVGQRPVYTDAVQDESDDFINSKLGEGKGEDSAHMTTASLDISAGAITWGTPSNNPEITETMAEFEEVKEGAEIMFEVMDVTDEEILKLPVYVGGQVEGVAPDVITFKEYLSAREDKSHKLYTALQDEAYSLDNVIPIKIFTSGKVSDNFKGVFLGYVHVPQWATKFRTTGDVAVQQEVADEIKEIRKTIHNTENPGSVIQSRKSNIQSTQDSEGGWGFKGTAIRTLGTENGRQLVNKVSEVHKEGVTMMAIVTEDGRVDKHASEWAGERELIVPSIYPPGTPVIIVPLENSDILVAQRVVPTQLDTGTVDFLVDNLLNLAGSNGPGMGSQNFHKATKASFGGSIRPYLLKQIVGSLMNVAGAMPESNTKELKIKISASEYASPEESKKFYGKVIRGDETEHMTITMKLAGSVMTQVYEYSKQGEYVVYTLVEETINNNGNEAISKEDFITSLKDKMKTNSEAVPHYATNLSYLHSTFSPPTLTVNANGEGNVVKNSNYAATTRARHNTDLAKGKTTRQGKTTFSVNTITRMGQVTGNSKPREIVGKEEAETQSTINRRKGRVSSVITEVSKIVSRFGRSIGIEDLSGKKLLDAFVLPEAVVKMISTNSLKTTSEKDIATLAESTINYFLSQSNSIGLLVKYVTGDSSMTSKLNELSDEIEDAIDEEDLSEVAAEKRKRDGSIAIIVEELKAASDQTKGSEEGLLVTSLLRILDPKSTPTKVLRSVSGVYSNMENFGNAATVLEDLEALFIEVSKGKHENDAALEAKLTDFVGSEVMKQAGEYEVKDTLEPESITDPSIKKDVVTDPDTDTEVESLGKQQQELEANGGSPFSIIRSILVSFNYKTSGSLAFDASERAKIAKSLLGIGVDAFLGTNKETIDRDTADAIYKVIVDTFKDNLKDSRKLARAYRDNLTQAGREDSSEYAKVLQYIAAISDLLKSKDRLSDITYQGYLATLRELGYKTLKEKKTEELSEVEANNTNDDQEAHQEINHSLYKNPKDTVTARVKAKLSSLNMYTVNPAGEVGIERDIIGNPIKAEFSYLTLLNIFSKSGNHGYKPKLALLANLVDKIKANPHDNAALYFLIDLQDQLLGTNKDNLFTEQEQKQFNVAMNKNELVTGTLIISGSRLYFQDLNHASITTSLTRSFKVLLDNLYNSDYKVALRNIIYPKGKVKDALTGDYTTNSYSELNVALIKSLIASKGNIGNLAGTSITKITDMFTGINKTLARIEEFNSGAKSAKIDRVLRSEFSEYLVGDTIDMIALKRDLSITTTTMANEVASRMVTIMHLLKAPIQNGFKHTIVSSLINNYDTSIITLEGASANLVPVSSILSGLMLELSPYLANRSNKKERSIKKNIRTFMHWLSSITMTTVKAAMVRVKDKTMGTYTDPVSIIDTLNKLRASDDYRNSLKKFFVLKENPILKMLSRQDVRGPLWLQGLMRHTRAGILPSFMSTTTDPDTPMAHLLYVLGNYMKSIELGDPNTSLGRVSEVMSLTINNANGKNKTHKIKVREAEFVTLTFGDKESPFMISNIDVSMASLIKGEIAINDDVVRYIIDTVIVPELALALESMKAIKDENSKASPTGIAEFNPELVYSLPILNTPEFRALLAGIADNLKGPLTTLYNIDNTTSKDVDTVADIHKLEQLVKAALMETVNKEADNMITHMQDVGMIVKVNGELMFNEELRATKEFTKLNYTHKEYLDSKEGAVALDLTEENARKGVVELQNVLIALSELNNPKNKAFSTDFEGDLIRILSTIFDEGALKVALDDYSAQANKVFKNSAGKLYSTDAIVVGFLRKLGISFNTGGLKRLRKNSEKGLSSDDDSAITFLANGGTKLLKQTVTIGKGKSAKTIPLGKEDTNTIEVLMNARYRLKNASGEVSRHTTINPNLLRAFIINFNMGQVHSNSSMMQLVHGGPSNYFKEAGINTKNQVSYGARTYDAFASIAKTISNLGKRLGKEVSPSVFSDGSVSGRYIVINDPIGLSRHYTKDSEYNDLNGTYTDSEGNERTRGIEMMDGASYSTVKAAIEFLLDEGAVSKEQSKDLARFWTGEITEEKLNSLHKDLSKTVHAATMKPRVVGHRTEILASGEAHRVPVYIKMAETVLTPHITRGNPELEKIRLLMEHEEARTGRPVRLVPHTGIKTGAPANRLSLEDIAVVDGKIQVDKDALIASSIDISMSDYGRQLKTGYKADKQVTNSGQMEDLMWNSITSKSRMTLGGKSKTLREHWVETRAAIFQLGFNKLDTIFSALTEQEMVDAFNADGKLSDKEVSALVSKKLSSLGDSQLRKVIIAALKAQDKGSDFYDNPYLMSWLDVDSNGDFINDVTESHAFMDYLDAIRVMIEKTTVKRKRRGAQLPLKPDTGYDIRNAGLTSRTTGGNKAAIEGVLIFDDADVEPDGSLRPQLVPKDGKARPAQILVSSTIMVGNKVLNFREYKVNEEGKREYKYLIKKGNKWFLNSAVVPKSALEAIGFRTPTQDYNMMAHIEIIGILPQEYKSTVVGPKEWVEQMGSDFDIDKLFAYLKYLKSRDITDSEGNVTGVKISEVTEADAKADPTLEHEYLQNRKQAILREIMTLPSIIKGEVVASLRGEEAFMDFAEVNDELIESTNTQSIGEMSYLFPTLNMKKRDNASTAGLAVAVFAKLARVSSMLQYTSLKLFTVKGNETKAILGSSSVTELGSQNEGKLFKPTTPTEGKYDESTYDKIKNNISALLSIAVDNENLQMVHKLGLNQQTYDSISGLILSGFRGKTAIALTNLPLFREHTTSIWRDSLVKAYNSNNTDGSTPLFSARRPSADSKDKRVIEGGDFSKNLSEMEEMELVDYVQEIHRSLKGDIGEMSQAAIIDAIALIDFVDTVTVAYSVSVKKFGWMFNMDSKGFLRDLKRLFRATTALENPKKAKIVKALTGIPEIATAVKAFRVYSTSVDRMFSKDPTVKEVTRLLTMANEFMDINLFDISRAVRGIKYKKTRPNTISIVNRIEALANNTANKDVVTFVNNNLFFRRLGINNKQITFTREEGIIDRDIIKALSEFVSIGTLGGIDMALLRQDLMAYAITNQGISMGQSFLFAINPTKFTELSSIGHDKVDPNEVAAFLAYTTNLAVHRTDETDIDVSSGVVRLFENPAKQVEGAPRVLTYLSRTNQLVDFSEGDKTLLLEGTGYEVNATISPVVPGTAIEQQVRDKNGNPTGQGTEFSFDKTLERVLTFKSELGVKSLYKMLTNIKQSFVHTGNVFSTGTRTLRITGSTTLAGLKADLTHEGMHAMDYKLVKAYLKGTLEDVLPGRNEEGKNIAMEIGRIYDTIEASRKNIILNLVDDIKLARTESRKVQTETSDEDFFSQANAGTSNFKYNEYATNLTYMVFNKMLDGGARSELLLKENLTSAQIARNRKSVEAADGTDGTLASTNKVTAMLSAITNGKYKIENEMFYYITDSNKAIPLYTMSPEVGLLLEEIGNGHRNKGSFATTKSDVDNIVASLMDDNYLTDGNSYKLFYGLSHLQEFTASAFEMGGIKATTDRTLHGYSALLGTKVYNSAVTTPIPSGISRLYKTVIEAIREIVRVLVGSKQENLIFRDAMYAAALAQNDKFVHRVTPASTSFTTREEADEILKNCK